jgi:hypothetical protein
MIQTAKVDADFLVLILALILVLESLQQDIEDENEDDQRAKFPLDAPDQLS